MSRCQCVRADTRAYMPLAVLTSRVVGPVPMVGLGRADITCRRTPPDGGTDEGREGGMFGLCEWPLTGHHLPPHLGPSPAPCLLV